jgi:hypothetical protein
VLEATVDAALREIVVTRAALDSLEAALVVRARSRGATWTQLAAALGLTKQGVRRRHLSVDPVFARRLRAPPTIEEYHAELVATLRARGITLG